MAYHLAPTDDFVRGLGMQASPSRKSFDSPPCLLIEYATEEGYTVRDFLPIEHSGQLARAVVARAWFQMDGQEPLPATVDEALSRIAELQVYEIELQREKNFAQVVSRRCYPLMGPPNTFWAHGPPPPMWQEERQWRPLGAGLPKVRPPPLRAPARHRAAARQRRSA